ncbi:SMI1/KNR4 family protein [Pyxidicoccus parkwayensis]|uniref:SMI1/KNR4 family protein n=1 Tax=Pyxidicoccus parkwayensis TaxID=2813578 RepID=A0ABX7NSE6_9BACT|nr:SMI1/KNR4 family protein [Pyxidicoccus parkwaysis]QSQ20470.1 SMI1/KNR4 family protein [Pyxidicoccus parkwaysis]
MPLYHERLNGPAKPEEISALEAELGVTLPEDLKRLYLENNGERDDDFNGGSMMGLTFLSLEKIAWHRKQYILPSLESPDFRNTTDWLRSVPKGAVQDLYFHRNWIPLFTDGQGDYLGLDFAPGPNGEEGQFINFGSREEEHCLIADGMTSFLQLVNEKLEKHARDVVIIEDKGQKLVFGIDGEGHLTDDLRRWTRERYGVPEPR